MRAGGAVGFGGESKETRLTSYCPLERWLWMRESMPVISSTSVWLGPKDARLPYLGAIVKTNCDFGNLSGRGVDLLWFWRSFGIHSERRPRGGCPGVDILGIP